MEVSRSSEDPTDRLPTEANWDEDDGEDEGEGLDPRVQVGTLNRSLFSLLILFW